MTESTIAANTFVARPNWLKKGQVEWCESIDLLLCEFEPCGKTLLALGLADSDTQRRLRVPVFIQDEVTPICCGRRMQFVGQIDDNSIYKERPPGAALWWHDAASFYVFTCAVCLECKSIGQQF